MIMISLVRRHKLLGTEGSNRAPATNFQAKFGGQTKLAVADQLRKIAAPDFKKRDPA
jgi:hypothetical protein